MTSTHTLTSPSYQYVYHWQRIIPAVAVPLLGIGAVAWWLLSGHTPKPVESITSANTSISLPTPVLAEVAPAAPAVPSLPAQVPSVQSNVQAAPAGNVAPIATAATAAPALNVEKKPAAVTAVASAEARRSEAKSANLVEGPSAGIKTGQIRISSDAVSHVSLQQVLEEDPLAIAKGTILLSQNKAVKVLFSGDIKKPGEVVHYRWYHDGNLAAKVKTHVSPAGKTTGSKFISYETPGAWQVQMLDKQGKLLAETAFVAKLR